MTDREKLEKIVDQKGCEGFMCHDCPLDLNTCGDTHEEIAISARRLLAEMDNEWKPLEVDNLPPDILTGDYEFECWKRWQEWQSSDSSPSLILSQMSNHGVKYRYRLRKHEPSVEEMAEKYVEDNLFCTSFDVVGGCIAIDKVKNAYIAGYKEAKDGE